MSFLFIADDVEVRFYTENKSTGMLCYLFYFAEVVCMRCYKQNKAYRSEVTK